MLHHVDAEEGRVVALDRRLEGEQEEPEAGGEVRRAATGHRVGGMLGADAADGEQPEREDGERRERHQRRRGPVEERVEARLGGERSVGGNSAHG